MIAAAFKNRIQVQAGDTHVRKIIQFFTDTFQSAAKKIEIKDIACSRVFDITGQIIPASVQQRVGLTAELGQGYISPVKPVREDLIYNSLFHPVWCSRAPVIYRNLVRGRFLFVLLPPAT